MQTVPLGEGLDHRARRRGPPDGHVPDPREVVDARVRVERLEDPHPDRRHSRADGDPLVHEVLEQADGVEVRAGKHLLDAAHRARVREAPGVRVEHRDDGEADVVGVHPEAADHRQRVDRDRPVRVEDSLRAAGRAARVAHGRGGSLREVAVRERGLVGVREQLLVFDRAVRSRAVTDRDDVLEVAAAHELLRERPQHLVDDEHAVAAVRRDVRVVVGVQAQVQGVGDEAADRRAHVRLEVLRVVPHERSDAVAVLEAELAEADDEPLRPGDELGVRVAVPALVRLPARDLARAVELVRASEQ